MTSENQDCENDLKFVDHCDGHAQNLKASGMIPVHSNHLGKVPAYLGRYKKEKMAEEARWEAERQAEQQRLEAER